MLETVFHEKHIRKKNHIEGYFLILGPSIEHNTFRDSDNIYLRDQSVNEEKGEHKHVIPKQQSPSTLPVKPEPPKSSADKLKSQVKAHTKPSNRPAPSKPQQQTKRVVPSISAGEILKVSYPQPKIFRPPVKLNATKSKTPNPPKKPPPLPAQPPPSSFKPKPKPPTLPSIKKKPSIDLPASSGTATAQTEQDILELVSRLQRLSDKKLEDEIKGPILELAKAKLMEDLESRKVTGNLDNQILQNEIECKKRDCRKKPPVIQYPNFIPKPAALPVPPIPPVSSSDALAAMFPRLNHPSQLPPPLPVVPSPAPLINAEEVLNNFPELRANGITEETLQSLAARVPNLEQRIYAHFALKHAAMHVPDHNPLDQNDLATGQIEFMKNYKDFLSYAGGHGIPTDGSYNNLLPDQHKVAENQEASRFLPTGKENEYQQQQFNMFHEKQNENNAFPENKELPENNIYSPYDTQEQLACQRSGTCHAGNLFKPPASTVPKPENYAQKLAQSTNNFRDNTRFIDHPLMAQGPDPSIVDYYNSYMQGHDPDAETEPEEPPTTETTETVAAPPPALPPAPPPPPPPIDISFDLPPLSFAETTVSYGRRAPETPPPPGLRLPVAPPPPPVLPKPQERPPELPPLPPPLPPRPPPPQPVTPGLPAPPPGLNIEMTDTIEQLPPPVSVQASFPVHQLENVPSEIPVVEQEANTDWTPFSVCSQTCGKGEKKRFRRCKLPDCPSGGVEIETAPCAEAECPGKSFNVFPLILFNPLSANVALIEKPAN